MEPGQNTHPAPIEGSIIEITRTLWATQNEECFSGKERRFEMTVQSIKEVRLAYYLVKAKFKNDLRPDLRTELRARLDNGEIQQMRPFGLALQYSLDHARQDSHGWVTWEEEDYCHPPLAQERAAVLDTYFTDLQVEVVSQGSGWKQVESLPGFWDI